MHWQTDLQLLENYPWALFLAFQRRDPLGLSEQVSDQQVLKGFCWQGLPAQLQLVLNGRQLRARLEIDGDCATPAEQFAQWLQGFLALNQPIEQFEQHYLTHAELGPLIRQQQGLRVMQTATVFEALSWAILGQQVSVKAAVAVRHRLIQQAALRHSSGLWCYPDAHAVSRLSVEVLRQLGMSQRKAETLHSVANLVVQGQLLRDNAGFEPQLLSTQLLACKGIGPWTLSYSLLRGFGYLDGSLEGDVAVRQGLQRLLGRAEAISQIETQQWLQQFSPWRGLVAAHLWQSKALVA